MDWDYDYDVKEYRPRKRSEWPTANFAGANISSTEFAAMNFCNPVPIPDTPEMRQSGLYATGAEMSTAEILDFSEGTN